MKETPARQGAGGLAWGALLCLLLVLPPAAWAQASDQASGNDGARPNICFECDPEPLPLARDAQFVGQSVPAAMTAGQSYAVSVQMINTGTQTWTAASGYTLGSRNPADNGTWGLSRVPLPASVGPGETATFNFTVTAPATAANHDFQWGMLQEGVTWFGAWTANVGVTVSAAANAPPSVALTAPANGASGTAPADVTLTATASDSDGSIASVEFWSNGTLLGADSVEPYAWPLRGLAAGSYQFQAVATDNMGASTTSSQATYTVDALSVVTGWIDGLHKDATDTYQLSGWACSTALNQSIDVHLYVGGASGTGTFIASYGADRPSEPEVATACGATGTAYRFLIPIQVALRKQHANQAIYVHGISPVGGNNNLLAQSGTFVVPASATVAVTRHYVYDANEQLCKTINPESGAALVDYDAAGNILWSADGTTLTSLACDRESVTAGQKTTRTYDALNRVTAVSTPGGTADITSTYHADGLVNTLIAANPDGNNVSTSYSYNKRRLLTAETSSNGATQFTLAYGYSGNGHLSAISYPDNQTVTYAPDALGRATQVAVPGGATYASDISYYPGGAFSGFTYGNGIVHSLVQNTRRLPTRSRDANGATAILDDTYAFDPNGNVTDITDQAQAGLTTRGMAYDGLDRLTAAVSPGQWGNAIYAYDALDNLRVADQGSRQYRYNYDAVTQRLASITNPAGVTQIALGYDTNGNTTSKNSQSFVFDSANRLNQVTGQQAYRYDGQGRRVQTTDADGKTTFWIYSQSGQVLYTSEARRSRNLSYVYLGNTQVATRAVAWGTGATAVRYQHTDALGSPVAETDEQGAVVKRNSYAPYGEAYGAPSIDGTGYTGHVMDQATGLAYMQQRYSDPQIARLLSVDPVTIDSGDLRHFNRYSYAYNNPYKFTDPDGRCPMCVGFAIGAGIDIAFQVAGNMASGQEFGEAVSNVSMGQVLVSGALGSVGQLGGATAARTVVSGLSNGAKGKLGEAVARAGIAIRGEKVIASQTPAGKVAALGQVIGRGAKAVPDFVVRGKDGVVKVVEAKFGTAGLTAAQRDLKAQMGSSFTVSRTTVSEVANVGGAVGTVLGGASGSLAGKLQKDEVQ